VSKVTPLQVSFVGGEISTFADARIDLRMREISVRRALGWLLHLQGPAEACPGTIDHGALRAATAVAIPFTFNRTQSYVVEASPGKLRFYTNDVRIDTSPGVAYEIDAPWTAAQLKELFWNQSFDALYLYHPDVQTRKLVRLTATTFALEVVEYEGGPFDRQNQNKAISLSASSNEGDVTLSATAAIFAATDVGRLVRMEASDLGSIPAWDVGMSVTAGVLRQSNGVIYQAVSGGRTGGDPPKHSEGVEWDGMGTADANGNVFGVQWMYLHDRFGLLRITEYVSATEVEAEVLRRLPYSVSSSISYAGAYDPDNGGYYVPSEFEPGTYEWTESLPGGAVAGTPGTWRWQFGSFSDTSGWPQCGCIWQERHIVGHQSTVHGSVIGDLANFSPLNELGDVSRDQAMALIIPAADYVRWLASDQYLLVGTASAEYRVGPSSAAQGVGPGAVEGPEQTDYGSAPGMIARSAGRVLFIQAARQSVMAMSYTVERDRFDAPDLNVRANHIGERQLMQIAMQKHSRRLWAVCADGTLATALYDPREEALGWSTRALGGGMKATSVTCIPDPDGRFDQLWITATNSAGTAGRMLRMARVRDSIDVSRSRIMVDAAWIYSGSATTAINAPHLANATVDVVADGLPIPRVTLNGSGQATLVVAASQIIAGHPFPAELELLPLEAGGDNGPALMKQGRINKIGLLLHHSDGLEVTVQGQTAPVEFAAFEQAPGTLPPLYDGVWWVDAIGSNDRARQVIIRRILPTPVTVKAVMAEQDISQTGARNGPN
jgi:hypothetical protein